MPYKVDLSSFLLIEMNLVSISSFLIFSLVLLHIEIKVNYRESTFSEMYCDNRTYKNEKIL